MNTALADKFESRPVAHSRTVYEGMVWDVRRDTIDYAEGVQFERDYMTHPGAVAVLALTPGDEVVLVHQYRHPARATMWELPAGLLDHEGEDPADAALRELAEETGYEAERIVPLMTYFPTAGGSAEKIHLFVATGCTPTAHTDFVREAEEADMDVRTVSLHEIVAAALEGRITNGALMLAALAVHAKRGEKSSL